MKKDDMVERIMADVEQINWVLERAERPKMCLDAKYLHGKKKFELSAIQRWLIESVMPTVREAKGVRILQSEELWAKYKHYDTKDHREIKMWNAATSMLWKKIKPIRNWGKSRGRKHTEDTHAAEKA